jgi:RNA polymerase sigma-70 factor (ECF subfamily)
MSALAPAETGPTVDPDRFRDADDAYPGGWKVFPAPWPSPDHGVLGRDARTVVVEAIRELPDRQRAVVTLRDVHGFGPDEVCTMLDLSPGNQRVLLHRGRAAVRARLERHFGATARWGATP